MMTGCISFRLVSISPGRVVFHSDSAKKKNVFPGGANENMVDFNLDFATACLKAVIWVGWKHGGSGSQPYQTNLSLQSKEELKLKIHWNYLSVGKL